MSTSVTHHQVLLGEFGVVHCIEILDRGLVIWQLVCRMLRVLGKFQADMLGDSPFAWL